MHQDQKAVEQLELAAKQDPKMTLSHYILANVYRKMGLQEKAQEEMGIFNRLRIKNHSPTKRWNENALHRSSVAPCGGVSTQAERNSHLQPNVLFC